MKKIIDFGYVFAPYIIKQSTPVIIGSFSKAADRKMKINSIFNLGLNLFDIRKSILNKYSNYIVNSYLSISVGSTGSTMS